MDTCLKFCILLALLSSKLVSACLDGNCRNLAFPSFFFFANKRLVNHDIRADRVSDLDVCELLCYQEPNCVSVNFRSTSSSDGKYICELNNATHQGRDGQFKDKEGYFYHGADSACDNSPQRCKNDGTCQSGFTDKGFRCICFPGFTGEICEKDISECNVKPRKCGKNAKCKNSFGSYTCLCKSGYSGNGSICHDIDECALKAHNCNDDAVCNNTEGSFDCTCKPGFTGNGYKCEDVDECATGKHNCSDHAVCNNTKGGQNCTCKTGFTGDGWNCTDIDECATETHNCSDHAVCNNTKGGHNCTCKPGFRGNGRNCADVDECSQGFHDCHSSHASCRNTVGSYNCSCDPGYEGDGKTSCNRIPECKDYKKLDKADRKITHEGDDECDKDIGPGWFRFEGKAGTRMATSCTPKDRCDTVVTSWLNGDHPTVADGQVTRQVCFHYGDNCCNWSTNIKVRNCGSYYVYHFDGVPSCNARYCGTD